MDNEAIKAKPVSEVKPVATPGLMGAGAATDAMRKIRAKRPE